MNPDQLAKAIADAALDAVAAQIDKVLSGHPVLEQLAEGLVADLKANDAALIAAVEAVLAKSS